MKVKSSVTHEGSLKVATPSQETTDTTVVNASFIQLKAFASTANNNDWTGEQTFTGPATFNGNSTFNGDAEFTGGFTFYGQITAAQLNLNDDSITLNSGETGAGINNGTGIGGIVVDRGTLSNTTWQFNESDQKWHLKVGTAYANMVVGGLTADSVYLNSTPTHPNHAVTKNYIDTEYQPAVANIAPVVGGMLVDSNSIDFTYNPTSEIETASVKADPAQFAISSQRGLYITNSFLSSIAFNPTAINSSVAANATAIDDIKYSNLDDAYTLIVIPRDSGDLTQGHKITGIRRGYYEPWSSTLTYSINHTVTRNNDLYISLLNDNTNIEPGVHPSWQTYWEIKVDQKVGDCHFEASSFGMINAAREVSSRSFPFVEDGSNPIKIDGQYMKNNSVPGSSLDSTSSINPESDNTLIISLGERNIISAGPNGYAADNFLKIEDGKLTQSVWNGVSHTTSPAVFAPTSGIAAHGNNVFAGKFDHQPTILLSPVSLKTFDPAYVGQSQTLKLESQNLTQNPASSGNYYFDVKAILELGSSGNVVLNDSVSGNYNATIRRTATDIVPGVGAKRITTNLVANNYYYRQNVIYSGSALFEQRFLSSTTVRITLKYKISGIWYGTYKDLTFTPGSGVCSGGSYTPSYPAEQTVFLDTGTQAGDIQAFYVESLYLSGGTETVRCQQWDSGSYLNASLNYLKLTNYEIAYTPVVAAQGTVKWIAF